MTFKERVKLIEEYNEWIKEKNENRLIEKFVIPICIETFLVFLEERGLLKELNNEENNR